MGIAAAVKLGGEKSIGGGGATLVADGVPLDPYRSVLAWGRLGVELERC
jgi:hypothetical protein